MHTAPAVHLSLEADTPWRVGLCLLCAAAAATPVIWLVLWLQPAPGGALAGGAVAACVTAALLWRGADHGAAALAWDGTQWWLQGQGGAQPRAGRVQLMIDFGAWVLLRFMPAPAAQPGTRACWLALSQARHRPHWHALRCALHAVSSTRAAAADVPRRG
ncbi:hypothetical protein [Azohydromonas caseinilytica]|uniref:Toxin CptA n=1 Tax=Azohydromonas caseinilytica TaxID=2728836 RepID=A0A848F8G0_9BURK|nr:hypothetical protein [Azohydromonas caseinilytica]NML15056.1 hypothetical protein [Azohydromonas caseinilytica]